MSLRHHRTPAESARVDEQRWARVAGRLERREQRVCTAPARRVGPRSRRDRGDHLPAGLLLLSDRALYAVFEDAWLGGDTDVRIPLESIFNVEWRAPRRLGVRFTMADGRAAFVVADVFRTRLAEGRLFDDLRAQLNRVHDQREAEGFWER